MVDIAESANFSFTERPLPVPGDLRINWRLSVLLLILRSSRANRASLAKLYITTDAVRSAISRHQLMRVIAENLLPLEWAIRVEPALARAVDLLVGEGLAKWVQVAGRIGIEATPKGVELGGLLSELEDVLEDERAAILEVAKPLTEAKVTGILATHGSV